MHPSVRTIALATLMGLSSTALATDPIHIAPKLAVADDAGFEPGMLEDCPLQAEFSTYLRNNLGHGNATFTDAPLPTPEGRSLKVELTDFAISGNGFIGHRLYLRLRGTLYQDGKKVASFSDRAQFRGEWNTDCYQVRTSLRAEAYYVGRWVRDPVDGQELEHMGE